MRYFILSLLRVILKFKLIIRVDLAKCFEFSISEALESIKGQILACGGKSMASTLNLF